MKINRNIGPLPAIRLVSIVGRYDQPIYPRPKPVVTVADLLYRGVSITALRPKAKALLKG